MSDLTFQFFSTFIAMVIPLLFVAIMLGKGDSRKIILYFCWGVFAGVLAYNLNNLLGSSYEQANRMTLSIAPMIEEVCKGLPILFFLNRKKYQSLTMVILFCALASGVGFSIQESIYYFNSSGREIADILSLVVRTLTTALMHGMTTSIFGFGLMVTQKQRSMLLPLIFGLFAVCASIHALYNLLMSTPFVWLGMMMPIAMFFAGLFFLRNVWREE